MKVYLDVVGCRLNQSEIETYAKEFYAAGHILVATPNEADITVLNTCTVTAAAAADSRQKIRQSARVGVGKIVVTGCWATLQPDEASSVAGVSHVIPNQEKESLVCKVLSLDPEDVEWGSLPRKQIPGTRMRTRAFIKAQVGCDNHCTYCITRLARGCSRSIPAGKIIDDINLSANSGVREAVLTGVHLGAWGADFNEPLSLHHLISRILKETSIPRLRISSIEPWAINEQFFNMWEDHRLCRHLHLPLQSGCDKTLIRMGRNTTQQTYRSLLSTLRDTVPNIAITTDIIVGFPGETEHEFSESLEFVEEMRFAGGHVFTYSERAGTAASRMPGYVHNATRKERNALMRAAFARSAREFRSLFIGKQLSVLWESAEKICPARWENKGLADNYLRVIVQATQSLHNQINKVQIREHQNGYLIAELEGKIEHPP